MDEQRQEMGSIAALHPLDLFKKRQAQLAEEERTPELKGLNLKDKEVVLENVCKTGDPRNFFMNLTKIGQGASGTVYTAIRKSDNTKVALKIIPMKKQPKKELIINELVILKNMKHPNVVEFYDAFYFNDDLWLIMECMEGGCLTDIVTNTIMKEHIMSSVVRQVTVISRRLIFRHCWG